MVPIRVLRNEIRKKCRGEPIGRLNRPEHPFIGEHSNTCIPDEYLAGESSATSRRKCVWEVAASPHKMLYPREIHERIREYR